MSDAPESTVAVKPPEKNVSISLMLVWVLLLGTIGYLAWDKYQPKQADQSVEGLVSKQAAQQEQLDKLTTDLSSFAGHFQQIAEHDKNVVASIKQLDQAVNAGESAWALTQVQHFLELAAVEGQLLNNPDTAIQLLNFADVQLERMNNPVFLGLRQAIATDKQMLTQGVTITRTNAVILVNALVNNLPTLKQRSQLMAGIDKKESTPLMQAQTWKEYLWASLAEIKSLIVVRHHDDNTGLTNYSPDEAELVMQNLQLMLLQAASAAQQGDQSLFENHIGLALGWFTRYYDIHSPAGEQFIDALTKLKAQRIAPEKVTVFASQEAWNQAMKVIAAPAKTPEEPQAPQRTVTTDKTTGAQGKGAR